MSCPFNSSISLRTKTLRYKNIVLILLRNNMSYRDGWIFGFKNRFYLRFTAFHIDVLSYRGMRQICLFQLEVFLSDLVNKVLSCKVKLHVDISDTTLLYLILAMKRFSSMSLIKIRMFSNTGIFLLFLGTIFLYVLTKIILSYVTTINYSIYNTVYQDLKV